MLCSLTLLFMMWRGRILARHRARIARLRAGSRAAAGAHVDGFASMLLFVLQLRSAEKSENSSRISRVTLLQMESEFFIVPRLTWPGALSVHVCCGWRGSAAPHDDRRRRSDRLPGDHDLANHRWMRRTVEIIRARTIERHRR